ncbi:DUF397 domain-containing protein [Streptomyces sp. NRRL F-5135]|uniref:DUF397 domain-containing protein n=1 Tax=Streptomyces sp. NRRL F-5135 TaxID=1463858 RepID=UPI00099DF52E|nr:DUF397 domain-containing protein [Streptomyces sp. NRRL F-5135]
MRDEEARWYKSSHSGGSGTECVEVAALVGRTAIRDSKDPGGGLIAVPRDVWQGFVGALRQGRLTDPGQG